MTYSPTHHHHPITRESYKTAFTRYLDASDFRSMRELTVHLLLSTLRSEHTDNESVELVDLIKEWVNKNFKEKNISSEQQQKFWSMLPTTAIHYEDYRIVGNGDHRRHTIGTHYPTPLLLAIRKDQPRFLLSLLMMGPDIAQGDEHHNKTPLAWAKGWESRTAERILNWLDGCQKAIHAQTAEDLKDNPRREILRYEVTIWLATRLAKKLAEKPNIMKDAEKLGTLRAETQSAFENWMDEKLATPQTTEKDHACDCANCNGQGCSSRVTAEMLADAGDVQRTAATS